MGGGQLSLVEFLQNHRGKLSFEICPEFLSTFNFDYMNNDSDDDKIPRLLRKRLQKVAECAAIRGEGIHFLEFPSYFKDVVNQPLFLHDLGYKCLRDLIDDVPDLFIHKPSPYDRRDYFIYPAYNFTSKINDALHKLAVLEKFTSSKLLDNVVLNLRKLLGAYPEGLKIQDIQHIYDINYREPLDVKLLGFDNLEMFLSSIIHRVPLKFNVIDDEKCVHLDNTSDNSSDSSTESKLCDKEMFDKEVFDKNLDICVIAPKTSETKDIGFHAVISDCSNLYKTWTFPPNFDFSKFIPVYTSIVINPGCLYIKFAKADDFEYMMKELNNFYNGNLSENYKMNDIDIKVGASCIARSPDDCQWYRVQILSIPSAENVLVQFVDFGSKCTLHKSLLRYIMKEFVEIPAQALKCQLASIKPSNNATEWDVKSADRVFNLCANVLLMAKIEKIEADGICSIILSDTTGNKSVYIHEILCKEGLAEYEIVDPNGNFLDSC